MRIPIREQLALLILLASLISIAVISIAAWVSNRSFVLHRLEPRLALTASLKASQLASNLNLMLTTTDLISSRFVLQGALTRYNQGNNSAENWATASQDLEAIVSSHASVGTALLYQSVVFARNTDGTAGSNRLLNVTSDVLTSGEQQVLLPYACPSGAQAYLGRDASSCPYAYPPNLYPNLTYTTATVDGATVHQAMFNGDVIGPSAQSAILIGPWQVTDKFSLLSLTVPIINNTSTSDVLGFLSLVMDASLIRQVVDSSEFLDYTGEVLLVGPVDKTNRWPKGVLYSSKKGHAQEDFLVQYLSPLNATAAKRHPGRIEGTDNPPFHASQYPAIQQAITQSTGKADNSGAIISTHNEAGRSVAVGYAIPKSNVVNWLLIVEQARGEAWKSINQLRDIIIACLFATIGLMAIVAWPLAHFAVLPVRRLRDATRKTIEPSELGIASRSSFDSSVGAGEGDTRSLGDGGEGDTRSLGDGNHTEVARKEGVKEQVVSWRQVRRRRTEDREARREQRKRESFRIPGKVKDRKHIIKDELGDLTTTFNEMSDELMMQYSRLEDRVTQRTAELEQSKIAAEAANESKTLFIANISHELKTPLNGILGMCAVCMQEDDPVRLKRSLGIIYKSGDLLLNLLTDLLTFSKNQVGQSLSLDEKEFRLRDVSSQILAIFDKQAREGAINLSVVWEGVHNLPSEDQSPERNERTHECGPNGTGRMKDMLLWGDVQRILQVVINLVSNSLKFTPSGGSVSLTIRCLPDVDEVMSRKVSFSSRASRTSRRSSGRHKESEVTLPGQRFDTANAINIRDRPNALAQRRLSDHDTSPPPGLYLTFEFEVTDTGPGIPESLQERIFEPFVQGDLGLSRKFGGTGLGLSICSQLASLMHGTVSVRSVEGQGSTFTMKLPLRHLQSRSDSSASSSIELPRDGTEHQMALLDDEDRVPARHSRQLAADQVNSFNSPTTAASGSNSNPAAATDSQPRLVGLSQPFFAPSLPLESPDSQPAAMEKIAAQATRGGKIRVLVAEDNKVNQEVVLRMLKLEDIYDVTVAKDGQEALDLVKETMTKSETGEERKPFNLIFMDVQMPNVDGLQSTRLIREIGYQAPIVALTAFSEESNIKDCLDSGMNYFLSKPIRRPQLKKVLTDWCAPIPEDPEPPSPSQDRKSTDQPTTLVTDTANTSEAPDGLSRPNAPTGLGLKDVSSFRSPDFVRVKEGEGVESPAVSPMG